MNVCKKCKKPLITEGNKYCAICSLKRTERAKAVRKFAAKALPTAAAIAIAIITRRPPKKL